MEGRLNAPGTESPPADLFDPVAYQSALFHALANVKAALKRRQLDPLRYTVTIDDGLPVFAQRDVHQLQIGYNRFPTLSAGTVIPHEWMAQQAGAPNEQFLLAADDLVMAMKGMVQAAGKAL